MTTATGGRIRWEIIQKAMSRFDRARLKRWPTAPTSRAKQAAATTMASGGDTPNPMRTAARTRQPANSPITPRRGRYGKRMRAYAAADPNSIASAELPTATTTEFTYGRSVSSLRSTKMQCQASRDGWKSTKGRYTGPLLTCIGSLNDVIASQYSGKSTTSAHDPRIRYATSLPSGDRSLIERRRSGCRTARFLSRCETSLLIGSFLGEPPPQEADIGHCDEGHDEQEGVGDRRRLAEVEGPPADIGMQAQRLGRRSRAAVGQHVGQIDDLEGLDEPDEDDGRAHRQDCRQGDMAEGLPAVGAVHHRRLDGREVLARQRGQQERQPEPEEELRRAAHSNVAQRHDDGARAPPMGQQRVGQQPEAGRTDERADEAEGHTDQ